MHRSKLITGLLGSAIAVLLTSGVAVAVTASQHTVQKGEFLAQIAEQYEVRDAGGEGDWQRLCDANPEITNPNLVFEGQQIRIPGSGEQVQHRAECELPAPTIARPSGASKSVAGAAQARKGATERLQTGSASDYNLARLRGCESNGYADKRNRTYRGAYQFDLPTWQSVGGSGDPADAPPEEQDMRARMLQAREGWDPWPRCRVELGLW